MAALQLLAIAGYCASLRLALHHHKRTLHPVQLIFLGSFSPEAYLHTEFGNSMLKLGRFESDSPHADTDDLRMIPNAFQGGLLTNRDLPGTTLIITHLQVVRRR
jgi:hypothetical protein